MNPSCLPMSCRAPRDVSEGMGEKEAPCRALQMDLDVVWVITKEVYICCCMNVGFHTAEMLKIFNSMETNAAIHPGVC